MPALLLINGESLNLPIAPKSVQCVVTPPPYWALRDYGTARWKGGDPNCNHLQERNRGRATSTIDGGQNHNNHSQEPFKTVCKKCGAVRVDHQIGLEPVADCLGWATGKPCGDCYVCHMVQVFRGVWRVLRNDGVVWLNLGDSYAGGGRGGNTDFITGRGKNASQLSHVTLPTIKPKDLVGIPWRVALALQADGWWLRSDGIWAKPNPMPESIRDRPTKSHEYVFLFTKSPRYFYDSEAVKEESTESNWESRYSRVKDNQKRLPTDSINAIRKRSAYSFSRNVKEPTRPAGVSQHRENRENVEYKGRRNLRSVFNVATQPTKVHHFATFPEKLIEPFIKAGTSEKGRCPVCGAPWARMIIKGSRGAWNSHDHRLVRGNRQDSQLFKSTGFYKNYTPAKTVSWRPGCKHNAAPVPCVVFDPFVGSGTTALVSRQLGRAFIGVDLNFTYLNQYARQRLELDRLDAWTNGIQTNDDGWHELPLFQTAERIP